MPTLPPVALGACVRRRGMACALCHALGPRRRLEAPTLAPSVHRSQPSAAAANGPQAPRGLSTSGRPPPLGSSVLVSLGPSTSARADCSSHFRPCTLVSTPRLRQAGVGAASAPAVRSRQNLLPRERIASCPRGLRLPTLHVNVLSPLAAQANPASGSGNSTSLHPKVQVRDPLFLATPPDPDSATACFATDRRL